MTWRRRTTPGSSSSPTSREDLERRFPALKATLAPADGLWIAWPKKAAKIDGDLTFEDVQEVGLAHGLGTDRTRQVRSHRARTAVVRLGIAATNSRQQPIDAELARHTIR